MLNRLLEKASKNNNTLVIDDIINLNIDEEQQIELLSKLENNDVKILDFKDEDDNLLLKSDTYVGSGITMYLNELRRYPLLTEEETIALFKEYRSGFTYAKDKLICSNLRLVVYAAKKYLLYAELGRTTMEDLIEEGNLGLIRAIEKFDLSKNCRFSTYAMYWIRQAIRRYAKDRTNIISIPSHLTEAIDKINNFKKEYYLKYGVEATIEICAEEFNCSTERIQKLLLISNDVYSLDKKINEEEDTCLIDTLPSLLDESTKPEDNLYLQYLISEIKKVLTERELKVIYYRYGLDIDTYRTLEEVGKMFNISRERVRQIEAKALNKIRVHLSRMNIEEKHHIKR